MGPPPIRSGFLTIAQARKVLSRRKLFARELKGDLPITPRAWGGIDEAQLNLQAREIDGLNKRQVKSGGPVVLNSIEMNISPDGQGDMAFGVSRL